MKYLLSLLFVILSLGSYAQHTSYNSLKALLENKGQDLGQLECKWQKNGNARFKANTKEADEVLNKQARFVMCDSLFISNRNLTIDGIALPDSYSPAWLLPDGKVLFVRIKHNGSTVIPVPGGIVGGIIAGMASGLINDYVAKNKDKKSHEKLIDNVHCYLYDGKSYDAHDITPEEAEEILSANPAILGEYQKLSKKDQKRGAVILKHVLAMMK